MWTGRVVLGGDEGRNDARCVVSANGTFFFVLILTCFLMSIYVVYMLYMHREGCVGQRRFMKAQTTPEASFGP